MGDAADAFLEQTESAWRPLREAMDALDESEWERPTPAGWTVREMLAHVAFWDEASVPVITYMFRGQEIPKGDWFGSGFQAPEDRDWPPDYEHNAREAAWGRTHSNEDVARRVMEAHAASVGAVSTISDEEAARYTRYIQEHCDHYREHFAELQAGAEQ